MILKSLASLICRNDNKAKLFLLVKLAFVSNKGKSVYIVSNPYRAKNCSLEEPGGKWFLEEQMAW